MPTEAELENEYKLWKARWCKKDWEEDYTTDCASPPPIPSKRDWGTVLAGTFILTLIAAFWWLFWWVVCQ